MCGKDLSETLNHSVGCLLPSLRGQMLRRGRRQQLDCALSISTRGEADQQRLNTTTDSWRVCNGHARFLALEWTSVSLR